ncbi:hypothetical protein JCM8547_008054 [Rhodosporidiobolus lusitaniae]
MIDPLLLQDLVAYFPENPEPILEAAQRNDNPSVDVRNVTMDPEWSVIEHTYTVFFEHLPNYLAPFVETYHLPHSHTSLQSFSLIGCIVALVDAEQGDGPHNERFPDEVKHEAEKMAQSPWADHGSRNWKAWTNVRKRILLEYAMRGAASRQVAYSAAEMEVRDWHSTTPLEPHGQAEVAESYFAIAQAADWLLAAPSSSRRSAFQPLSRQT